MPDAGLQFIRVEGCEIPCTAAMTIGELKKAVPGFSQQDKPLYFNGTMVFDVDTVAECKIPWGGDLSTAEPYPSLPYAISVQYETLGRPPGSIEISSDDTLRDLSDAILADLGFAALPTPTGYPQLALPALHRSWLGGEVLENKLCHILSGNSVCVYPFLLSSHSQEALFSCTTTHESILHDSPFWQSHVQQSPLSQSIFLCAFQAVFLLLQRDRAARLCFLAECQARLSFPPADLAMRHIYQGVGLNLERCVISSYIYHLLAAWPDLPVGVPEDILFKHAPALFEDILGKVPPDEACRSL
eukprot:gene12656-354_t